MNKYNAQIRVELRELRSSNFSIHIQKLSQNASIWSPWPVFQNTTAEKYRMPDLDIKEPIQLQRTNNRRSMWKNSWCVEPPRDSQCRERLFLDISLYRSLYRKKQMLWQVLSLIVIFLRSIFYRNILGKLVQA